MRNRQNRGHAILPCACLFNNSPRVSLLAVMREWAAGTIYVVRFIGTGKIRFVTSSGDVGDRVGDAKTFYHDQTLANYGFGEIVNIIHYSNGSAPKPTVRAANNKYLELKAPVWCYK